MPIIQRQCIEAIKQRASLYDVARTYVDLKKAGNQWRGLSPFTHEKSPSFFIHPEKNVFMCYSSGNAGDVIRFVQLKENLPFQEAVEYLAHQFNIELAYEAGGNSPKTSSLRQEILAIHNEALSYFQACFKAKHTSAAAVRAYWCNDRQFTLDLAEQYSIGFAPSSKTSSLLQTLIAQKFSAEALQQCGLFYAQANNGSLRQLKPRFRGRLMIPIRDIQGRCIAFTARQLELTPPDDPARDAKYINSPETPIFTKSQVLFGLDQARHYLKEEATAIMVEGQLDVLRCWQHGIVTAIAPQGTAVTEGQLALIRRYTPKLLVVLDGDDAGQKAALRLLPLAFQTGLEVAFVPLPPGSDPDSLLAQPNQLSMQDLLANPLDAMAFAVKLLAPQGMKSSPSAKEQAFQTIYRFFQDTDSLTLAQQQLKKAGTLLGIYEYVIDQKLAHLRLKKSAPLGIFQSNEKLTSAEYQLLLVVLCYENIASAIAQTISPEWIATSTLYGKLLDRVLASIREQTWHGIQQAEHLFDNDKERNCFYQLISEEHPFESPVKVANQCIRSLFKNYYEKQRNKLSQEITNLLDKDPQALRQAQQQRINIRKLLNNPPQLILSS